MKKLLILAFCLPALAAVVAAQENPLDQPRQSQQMQQPTQQEQPFHPTPEVENLNRHALSGSGQQGPAELSTLQQQAPRQKPATPGLARRREMEPPTEFEQMVEDDFGQRLPLFGARLFAEPPATFAPVDQAPVPADYVLGPGDQLAVRIWGQVEFDERITVDRSGDIYIPRVGAVNVAGVRYSQLDAHLRQAVGRVFRNFELSASLGRLRTVDVFVVGQARQPGRYSVSSLSTLVNALFACGGPGPQGTLRHIQLKREGRLVTELDLYDLLLRGDTARDAALLPGDVIYIPPVGPLVALGGSVNLPAIYEVNEQTSVAELLETGGGFSTMADAGGILLERIADHRTRTVREVTAAERTMKVQDGDIVRVAAIVPSHEQVVTLRGNVANPGRYPWRPGMRVSDLIPEKRALLTRSYWLAKSRLVNGRATQYDGHREVDGRTTQYDGQREVGGRTTQYDVPRELDGHTTQYDGHREMEASPALEPARTLTQPREPNPTRASGRTRSFEMDQRPAQSACRLGGPCASVERTEINLVAPEVNWDYAVVQRLDPVDLSMRLIPFHLGRAVLEGNAADNLELQDGDIVVIFSQADMTVPQARQSRFVRLEGEVRSPGEYRIEPNETLRDAVIRAGGLTADAYLYGSEFTRRSAQEQQQEWLGELARLMENELAEKSAGENIRPEDASAETLRKESRRALIEQMRSTQARGRMVLGLHSADNSLEALPALLLEDGDRLLVPPRPSSVSVVGAVFNQSSYLYRRGARVHDYLKLAGRGTANADTKHLLLVRADGSVLSRKTSNLEELFVLPGDTLVLPARIDTGGWARSLRDWTQVASQLALTGASLAVISR